jgi:hypothetical protein
MIEIYRTIYRRLGWYLAVPGLCGVYLFIYFFMSRFQFPPVRDERFFWPMTVSFSRSFVPSLEQLRSYD